MQVEFISEISSFSLGVLASFAAWWLTSHYWTPKIEFSDKIIDYELESGASLFQSAFINCGRRDIIDIEISVRLGIKGFKNASGTAHHLIRHNASKVPVLSPGKHRRVRIFDTREKMQFVDLPSVSIRQGLWEYKTLRDMLLFHRGSAVRIHVFGYDSFSGVRKHFASRPYYFHDIEKGTFKGLQVVESSRFRNKTPTKDVF